MGLLDVMEEGFFDEVVELEKRALCAPQPSALMQGFRDEMEKQAIVGALGLAGKALFQGAKAGRMAGYLGTRAGVGAGVGAVGGGVTSKDGNFARGALRGAVLGGLAGTAVGGGQMAWNAARLGRAAGVGGRLGAQRAAYSGLRNAGISQAGIRGYAGQMRNLGRAQGWGNYGAAAGRAAPAAQAAKPGVISRLNQFTRTAPSMI